MTRRDGRWFWHPYTFGRMADHPTGYRGDAMYQDHRWWVVAVRYRTLTGQVALGHTPRSRWRLVALARGLRGQVGA
jgi:hypothetical protein